MDADTQSWIDSFSGQEDIHLLARDIHEYIEQMIGHLQTASGLNTSHVAQPLVHNMTVLAKLLHRLLDYTASAGVEITYLQQQLMLKQEEAEQQAIEISALQTRIQSKEKLCRVLEAENETMKHRLESLIDSFNPGPGS